jgi:hypothetical protein
MNYLAVAGLENYVDYEPTRSCFLDGRYWNLVLAGIDGVSTVPLKVTLKSNVRSAVWAGTLHPTVTNYIRVVIETDNMKHAALLIVNFENKRALFWNPVTQDGDRQDALYTMIQGLVKDFLLSVDRFKLICENHNVELELSTSKCPMRGHCNAYIIRKVFDWIDEVESDDIDILRFSAAIEDNYSHLLEGSPDVEYFWGFVGGALLGSALASRSRPTYVYPPNYGYPPSYGYGYGYSPGYYRR